VRLLIMGAPGSGKGTQAALLAQRHNVAAISTGDIFRELHTTDSALARQIKSIMSTGGYVPDDITNAIVADRLSRPDCRDGFILDGYPRTLAQVGALDLVLTSHAVALDAVIALHVDEVEVTRRLLARGTVGGRADDTEDTIRARQQLYTQQTLPLLDAYRRRALLIEIQAMGDVAAVSGRIAHALADHLTVDA
jgi:adenylate kinase